MSAIKFFLRTIRRYYRQAVLCKGSQIKLFNYLLYNHNNYKSIPQPDINSHWLVRFIKERGYLSNSKHSLSIFGIHGDKPAILINQSKYKLLYIVENVHVKLSPWYQYRDLLLENKRINLTLGFDYRDHIRYLRFPFWLMTLFDPLDDFHSINHKCNQINEVASKINQQSKFCAFICRDDYFGDRHFFANEVSKVAALNFPGKFMHNDDNLKADFGDDKHEYLKQFRFNLCPENSNNKGYVTEKIFDSIRAGCIPIYWGSDNNPEPDILNQNRILFLKLNEDNNETLEKIRVLNQDDGKYKGFITQSVFKDGAPEKIFYFFQILDSKLSQLIVK